MRVIEREGVIPWERFNELFLEKYFPVFMQNQMELKFLELKQGNMSVGEYETKFTELARFVPEQVDTDKKKAKRFEQGLKPWIKSRVIMFELGTYTGVVQKALIMESESEWSSRDRENKRRKPEAQGEGQGSGNFQSKQQRVPEVQRNKSRGFRRSEAGTVGPASRPQDVSQPKPLRVQVPDCKTCGKKHPGECRKAGITCYRCNQKGHYVSECPRPQTKFSCLKCGKVGHIAKDCRSAPAAASKVFGIGSVSATQPRARTFNMTMKDAVEDADVIAGTLPVNSVNT